MISTSSDLWLLALNGFQNPTEIYRDMQHRKLANSHAIAMVAVMFAIRFEWLAWALNEVKH